MLINVTLPHLLITGITLLSATLDTETGAVVVYDTPDERGPVVVALGVWDLHDHDIVDMPWGNDDIWDALTDALYAELPEEDDDTWNGPNDYSDDAQALASAGWGSDEDYGGDCIHL